MSEEIKEQSIIDKILDINPRYIWAIFLLVIIIPTLNPIGFPIEINEYSRDLYETIESLSPGSKVLVWSEIGWDFWPSEYKPGCSAVLQHMVDNDLKVYFVSWGPESPVVLKFLIDNMVNMRDYKYGEDYIQFGFYAGKETAHAALAQDIRALVQVDYQQKKPIDSFPMMDGVMDASDFDFLMDWGCSDSGPIVRQYVEPFGLKFGTIQCSGGFPSQISWYNAGQMDGFIAGIRGAAEYEFLIDKPRWGIAQLDAINTTHLTMVAILIFGNALVLIKKFQGGT
jgi:hypothetical protein